MKIAVIGGASSYTPELVDGLYHRLDSIPVSELWLMDPNAGRLAITAGLARRMGERHGNPFPVHDTNDLVEAVTDAAYVITQIRVGGSHARIQDEKLGLRHDLIGQETTGVGGFACALRTIPRILDVAAAMEAHAPNGVLINFTNPAGIITEAVIKHSNVKTVGLCNIPIGMVMDVCKVMDCAMESVEMDYVGLNHLSWVRKFMVDETDVTDTVFDAFLETAADEWAEADVRNDMITAMQSLNMFCNYYLQYYYATGAALKHLKEKKKTRGEEVVDIEEKLFEKYQQPGLAEKPAELSQRGGAHYSTAALHLLSAIENDSINRQVVCCRNNGAVPTFDDDVAVEVSAIIGEDGAEAIPQEAPEPEIRGLMQLVKAYESLTVEAAVSGDRDPALQALIEHPLLPGATQCHMILDEVLAVNQKYLKGTFF